MKRIYGLQGKNYIEDSYLYLNQKYKYFEVDKADTQKTFVLAISRNI